MVTVSAFSHFLARRVALDPGVLERQVLQGAQAVPAFFALDPIPIGPVPRCRAGHDEVETIPVPLEGEPLIFDPDFDTPTPYTDEKMTNMMVEAMEAAGIPDHLIFAYRKTGMIMGAENAGLWTEKEINEWNAAIAEYEALHGPIGEEG